MTERAHPLDGKYVTVFTDASFCDRSKAFGWAAWVKWGRESATLRVCGNGYAGDNNDAEFKALEQIVASLCHQTFIRQRIVVLQSDSTTAIDKGQPLIDALIAHGAVRAYFKHVKAHTGAGNQRAQVNNWCDRVARREMRRKRNDHNRQRPKISGGAAHG